MKKEDEKMMHKVDDHLAHFGILGMKWGVRNEETKRRYATEKILKKNAKLERKEAMDAAKKIDERSSDIYIDSYNKATKKWNPTVAALNAKWEKKFEGYDNWADSPNYDKYEEAMMTDFSKYVIKEIEANPNRVVESASGKKFVAEFNEETGGVVWKTEDDWTEHKKKLENFRKEQKSISEKKDPLFKEVDDKVSKMSSEDKSAFDEFVKEQLGGRDKVDDAELYELVLNEFEEKKKVTHSDEVDDYLAHYGILGMKWGVRNEESQARWKSRKAAKRAKQPANMSDEDLKKRTARMQLEKQFKDAAKHNRPEGQKIAEKILLGAVTTAATGVATKELVKFGNLTVSAAKLLVAQRIKG